MRKLMFVLLLWFSAANAALVHAAEPVMSDKSAREIKLVVQTQLKAFATDDAKRAFSLADKNIQQMFGNADQFLQMVRDTYPVVYRPASVAFFKPQLDGKAVVQRVALTDGQGNAWVAVYRLEQQENRAWRIAGCVLMPDTSQRT